MTDKEKLAIYDQLREAHILIKAIDIDELEDMDYAAITAVDNVLYLAEGHFARMSE